MTTEGTIFHCALCGDVHGVARHLSKGVDVNARDEEGDTALVWAYIGSDGVKRGDIPPGVKHMGIIKLLCDSGADVNIRKKDSGKSVLMAAAGAGLLEVVKILYEYKAEINTTDRLKITPLMYATDRGHEDVCRFLVEKGSEVNTRDHNGSTPLMYAASRGCSGIAACLCHNGAELEVVDKRDCTALSLAIAGAFQDTIQVLCDWGAIVNLENPEIKRLYDMMKAFKKRAIVELLETKDFSRRVGVLLLDE